jgi:hypothetical protein
LLVEPCKSSIGVALIVSVVDVGHQLNQRPVKGPCAVQNAGS